VHESAAGTLLSYAERQVTVEIRTRTAARHRAPDDPTRSFPRVASGFCPSGQARLPHTSKKCGICASVYGTHPLYPRERDLRLHLAEFSKLDTSLFRMASLCQAGDTLLTGFQRTSLQRCHTSDGYL
jgi:hypothetical protein